MAQIWSDIEKLLTPTWVTSVPPKLGDPNHGKLKADQWRALGTIHLPVSLIHLWSTTNDNDPRSMRLHKILEVTMSLVSAVVIATSYTTSPSHTEAYLHHMLRYLNGIRELFPEYDLRPNHHMALHIHEYLLLFGPVHSWWTFPFERMIGLLQRMHHNGKIGMFSFFPFVVTSQFVILGDLEETMARAYTRSANLRALLLKSGCPEVIHHSEQIFRKLVNPQVRNTLDTDIRTFSSLLNYNIDDDSNAPNKTTLTVQVKTLPEDLRLAFVQSDIAVPSSGQLLNSLDINGLTYSTSATHKGNSCAMIFPADPIPAQIVYIVQFPQTNETYIAVRRHKKAAIVPDPYAQYRALRARLWDPELTAVEVVRLSQIVSHFSCLPLELDEAKYIVAISLSRTSEPPL